MDIANLYFYHIWIKSTGMKIPAVSMRPLDNWNGQVNVGDCTIDWEYEKLDVDSVKKIIDRLGQYDSVYGFNLQIYSLDTARWYKNQDEFGILIEDLYIKLLAGI